MIATGGAVGLAEWIIENTCLVMITNVIFININLHFNHG